MKREGSDDGCRVQKINFVINRRFGELFGALNGLTEVFIVSWRIRLKFSIVCISSVRCSIRGKSGDVNISVCCEAGNFSHVIGINVRHVT